MCEECRQWICPSSCPGYSPPVVTRCSRCRGDICEDEYEDGPETITEINGKCYCRYCVDDCTYEEEPGAVCDMCGYEVAEAESFTKIDGRRYCSECIKDCTYEARLPDPPWEEW